jgi:hypothetical protein
MISHMTSESAATTPKSEKVRSGIKAGTWKAANLFADRHVPVFGNKAKSVLQKRRHDSARQAHGNQEERAQDGGGQRPVAYFLQ